MRIVAMLLAAAGLSLAAEKADKSGKAVWLTDFAEAQTKAKAEGKNILMDFTGSDWCPWCIKLDKEVFDKSEFKDYAAKNLILVLVDFPHEKRMKPSVEKQNKKLAETYNVNGFPSVLIVDAEGKKVGQTGYVEGGAAKWVAHLQKISPPKP